MKDLLLTMVMVTLFQIVCFLDYSDFFHFNFTTRNVPDSVTMPPLHAGEATRLIIMEVKVVRIDPPGPDEHPDWPIVHYEGQSRSLDDIFDDNANSDLRGKSVICPIKISKVV
jgi:hypothetical protein